MSLETKKIEDKMIDRLMDEFTSHLDVDDILLAKCLSKGLIMEDNMSRIGTIFRGGRTAESAMDLMSHVKRSAPGYLKTFCDILNDSKSSFLVPCIEEEYRIQSEENLEFVCCMFPPSTYTTDDLHPPLTISTKLLFRPFLDSSYWRYGTTVPIDVCKTR